MGWADEIFARRALQRPQQRQVAKPRAPQPQQQLRLGLRSRLREIQPCVGGGEGEGVWRLTQSSAKWASPESSVRSSRSGVTEIFLCATASRSVPSPAQ